MNYIQRQYKTITLQSLAAFFHYSERQMSRIVQQYTGQSFTSLVRSLRLKNAENLLINSTMSMAEIGMECGYHDMKNFYQQFQKMYGCTPKEYCQASKSD